MTTVRGGGGEDDRKQKEEEEEVLDRKIATAIDGFYY
jgi:hypothetical protein